MTKQHGKLVVNIIGHPGCGKSSVCELLAASGFFIHRPSDVIRAYAQEMNLPLRERQDYVNAHHAMNLERPYAIVEPVVASQHSKICIDGMRSPGYSDKLHQQIEQVVNIALVCPIEVRFKRIQADDVRKGTHRAPTSLEAFQADELPDYYNEDQNLPNMEEMMASADYTIDATQPLQSILAQMGTIIDKLNKLSVPSLR